MKVPVVLRIPTCERIAVYLRGNIVGNDSNNERKKTQKGQACASGCEEVKSMSTLCGPMTACQTRGQTYSLQYCCNSVSGHKMG